MPSILKQFWIHKTGLILILFSLNTYSSDTQTLNEGLPVMVDSKTELNQIILKDMTVTYLYKIKDMDLSKALNIKDKNKIIIEENACSDDYIHDLFQKDLDVKFVYQLQDKEILSVYVNKELCSQLNNRIEIESEAPYQNRNSHFNQLI